ncbi:unnamed protein product [Eretmochelys imbricata]
MSDIAKDKAARLLKKRGSVSSLSSHEVGAKEILGKNKDSMSIVSYMDEPGHDIPRLAIQLENTYQLGPAKRFPVVTVNNILKDVLTNYLQEEKYEAELCRQMTKTISEVIKARVKDLMIPRYKIIVIVHIGQLNEQSMRIGSRCVWDPASDTFSSYSHTSHATVRSPLCSHSMPAGESSPSGVKLGGMQDKSDVLKGYSSLERLRTIAVEDLRTWQCRTMESMEPARITLAIRSTLNTTRIIQQYMQHQNLAKRNQASRRHQRGDESGEDMDKDFSQSMGPGNAGIMVLMGQVHAAGNKHRLVGPHSVAGLGRFPVAAKLSHA